MRRAIMGALLVTLAACSGSSERVTVSGQVRIYEFKPGHDITDPGFAGFQVRMVGRSGTCAGVDALDVRSVTVKDAKGQVVGTASLGAGKIASGQTPLCVLPFTARVPKSGFYTVEAGGRSATVKAGQPAEITLGA